MKEIRRVRKVRSHGDVCYIERANGEIDTFTSVDNVDMAGANDVHTANGVTEGTFSRGWCVIQESEAGKKVISCHDRKLELTKEKDDDGSG